MKIEPTPIAAAALIPEGGEREAPHDDATALSEPMRYEDLLPYLLLPMAGAY